MAMVVAVQQALALLAVGLFDRLLDVGDGLVPRQDAGDGEEAGLHDGVDAPAHAGALGDAVGIDDVEGAGPCRSVAAAGCAAGRPRPVRRGRRC